VLAAGVLVGLILWVLRGPDVLPSAVSQTQSQHAGQPSTESLLGQLRHEHFLIRESAARTLRARGWQPRDDAERAWLLVGLQEWEGAVQLGDPAIEPLAVAFAGPGPTRYHAAAEALGRVGSDDAVRILGETLRRGPDHLRYSAARALGDCTNPKAVDMLITALPDLPPDLFSRACQSLGMHRDPRVLPVLAKALASQDPDVRQGAACGLGDTRDMGAVTHLARALHDPEPDVRRAAASSLLEILHREAIPMLLEAVREERLDASVFVTEMHYLGPPAIPALTGTLRNSSPRVRLAAVLALGYIPDPQVIAPLSLALEDEDEAVRNTARSVLDEVRPFLEAEERGNSN